ncbi:MAG: hypothetical protein DMG07_28120 [Acidobacteria bacterium]|nr:MAG: hypothetical protein DMG07_28120 [Acidobacteriota bacterium]
MAQRISARQWTLAFVILALGASHLGYRFFVAHRLEQTAGLFIGLPMIIGVLLALTPRAKSVTGMICKTMTIALVMSGLVLGEGFICILMAAPLFYLVGIIIGLISDAARRQDRRRAGVLALLPLGISSRLSFDREETVTVVRAVTAPAEAVESAIAATPRFDRPLPPYLRLRFPVPVEAAGAGLETGALRGIHFAGGEGKPGDLVLRVGEKRPGAVTFTSVSDTSHIAHWLQWRSAEVSWRPIDGGSTEVRWTLRYRRLLDPAWYFGPWERYAVRLAAGYLIDTVATPGG